MNINIMPPIDILAIKREGYCETYVGKTNLPTGKTQYTFGQLFDGKQQVIFTITEDQAIELLPAVVRDLYEKLELMKK